jgi:hypothetical protein
MYEEPGQMAMRFLGWGNLVRKEGRKERKRAANGCMAGRRAVWSKSVAGGVVSLKRKRKIKSSPCSGIEGREREREREYAGRIGKRSRLFRWRTEGPRVGNAVNENWTGELSWADWIKKKKKS